MGYRLISSIRVKGKGGNLVHARVKQLRRAISREEAIRQFEEAKKLLVGKASHLKLFDGGTFIRSDDL